MRASRLCQQQLNAIAARLRASGIRSCRQQAFETPERGLGIGRPAGREQRFGACQIVRKGVWRADSRALQGELRLPACRFRERTRRELVVEAQPQPGCGLWVADYHDSPEIPLAWEGTGWRVWQYAGDETESRPAYGQTSIVRGVSHCDRNLFNGDASELYRFWGAAN